MGSEGGGARAEAVGRKKSTKMKTGQCSLDI